MHAQQSITPANSKTTPRLESEPTHTRAGPDIETSPSNITSVKIGSTQTISDSTATSKIFAKQSVETTAAVSSGVVEKGDDIKPTVSPAPSAGDSNIPSHTFTAASQITHQPKPEEDINSTSHIPESHPHHPRRTNNHRRAQSNGECQNWTTYESTIMSIGVPYTTWSTMLSTSTIVNNVDVPISTIFQDCPASTPTNVPTLPTETMVNTLVTVESAMTTNEGDILSALPSPSKPIVTSATLAAPIITSTPIRQTTSSKQQSSTARYVTLAKGQTSATGKVVPEFTRRESILSSACPGLSSRHW